MSMSRHQVIDIITSQYTIMVSVDPLVDIAEYFETVRFNVGPIG